MKHMFRLIVLLFRASLLANLEYRSSFFAGVFSTLLWVALAITSISVLTYQTSSLGGWTKFELFAVQGVYSVLLGLMYFLFIRNLKETARLVWNGDLDLLLVKPIDSQFFVSIGKYSLYHLARVFAGVVLIVYSLHELRIVPTIGTIVSFLIFLVSSMLVVYSLWFMLITLSFWLIDLFNITDLLNYVTGLSRYPLEILRFVREYLMYILMPLVVITTVPTQALLNRLNTSLAIWSLVLGVVLLSVSRKFWKLALRSYSSTGS